jgi:hypothetical protein
MSMKLISNKEAVVSKDLKALRIADYKSGNIFGQTKWKREQSIIFRTGE